MDYLPEISRIIDYGLNGNKKKLTSQVELLIMQLKKKGDVRSAEALHKKLSLAHENIKSQTTAFSPPIPVERDNRFQLADETHINDGDIWLALPENLENYINRFLSYLNNKEKLINEGVPVNPTMILHGPPGTGKTKLAGYIASKLNLPLVTARTDALVSSYLGSTSKNIRMLMDYAQTTPCVLFLDEFDALAKGRDDSNEVGELKRVVVSLLQNIDNLKDVVLIAATNHPELLDKAIWRRFQYKIEVNMPDISIRKRITEKFLMNHIDKKSIDLFTVITEGLSGADIEATIYEYLRENILNDTETPVSRLLQIAISSKIPSIVFLNDNKKQEIMEVKLKFDLSYEKIAKIFNVSKTYISRIVNEGIKA